MKTVSIIRNRGQLTIPDNIRKRVSWVNSMSAVSVTLVKPNQIIIEPQRPIYDKEDILAGIVRAQSIKGSGKAVSAAEFLEGDRRSH
jgi:bifunctional DNA-binding transcriptional regulator/antitoxin component of YhaV-PrlF toxin-antitoxin module